MKRSKLKKMRTMKNNLLLKLIIIAVAVSLIVCSLAAVDSHIDFCDDDDCAHCRIIMIAQSIMQIALSICIIIIICLSYKSLVSKMHIVVNYFMHLSLVNQFVQFNE